MIIALLLFIFFISIVLIFSSKKFSPIPYFPSNRSDLNLIIKSLNLKNNQIVFDLGAGDGIIIFAAAKEAYKRKLNTKFIAVEINPILLIILNIRRLLHINRNNISVIKADIFKMNFNPKTMKQWNTETIKQYTNITIYLYISPWYLEEVIKNCKLKIEKFKVVSYMYPIKSLRKKEKIIKGKNLIFSYDF